MAATNWQVAAQSLHGWDLGVVAYTPAAVMVVVADVVPSAAVALLLEAEAVPNYVVTA